MLERVRTTQDAIQPVLDEFQPDAVWSRSIPVGLGIRRGGYQGPLLQIIATNARMHCRGEYLQTQGLPIRRRIILLGLWPIEFQIFSKLERELVRKCKAIAFSESMRDQLLRDFPKRARSCHVIRPGVDTDVFSPENGSRYFEKIEQAYGLSCRDSIVLYVGRLSCTKRIPMLMDAVSALKTNTKLVVVGGGSNEAHLKQYAQRIGLGDSVVFAGVHHEMLPGFFALSRVCVLPSLTESFGQVLLEALASGTPAVGFEGNGRNVLTATSEIIRDGKTGGIVKRVSATALAEKIDTILSLSNDDYAAMSQCAREDVLDRFSWSRFVAEALKISTSTRQGPNAWI
jgi:glycosyltransferase involved in cell wall biosynthesis